VLSKKELDEQVEVRKKEAKEFEVKMRQKVSTIGNIVGPNAPNALTEVSDYCTAQIFNGFMVTKDKNVIVRTWQSDGKVGEPVGEPDIMPHHEVLLRLDAIDLDRGMSLLELSLTLQKAHRCRDIPKAPRLLDTEGISSPMTGSISTKPSFLMGWTI